MSSQVLSPPQLSFVMAAYNAAPWIEAAIASALAQEDVSVEVLVVDDASTDDTAARVTGLAAVDERVRLLRRSSGGGPASARNLALDHARGDWVAILDADDLVEPGRSRILLDLAARTGCAVVADNVLRFLDADPTAAWPLLKGGGSDEPMRIDLAEYLRRNRMTDGDANLGYLKPVFARSFIESHGIRYDERLRIGEDFNFCLQCLAMGTDLAVVPQALYRYRVLAGSLSRRLGAADLRKLLAVHDEALAAAPGRRKDLTAANGAYRRSILDILAYVEFRAVLDRRDWSGSLRQVLRPSLWRAIAEVGSGSLSRRFARRRAARRAAAAGAVPVMPASDDGFAG